jgi:hypothetical protein
VKPKLAAAIFALVAMPALAFARQGGPPSKVPKPTRADAQKVAQIISSDKAKSQSYCESKKLYDQMAAAYKKNDSKTADALNKQADALASKLGPEYSKMMEGLEQVDANSSEGKEFMAILSGLDKLCTGPALAQSGQPALNEQAPVQSASDQPAPTKPCAQIRAACTQAGFIPNGASMGIGINVDCIRPIVAGTSQRKRAAKSLPQIDPQVVVACKNRNPNFGMGGGAKAQSGGQLTNPSSTMEAPNE